MSDPVEGQIEATIEKFRAELHRLSRLVAEIDIVPGTNDHGIVSLALRICSLANVGLIACSRRELYAAGALVRCLAEHWIRMMSLVTGSAPTTYFGELETAERVDVDRRIRRCFPPDGQMPDDIEDPIRGAISAALLSTPPTQQERQQSRDVLKGYQFEPLFDGLLSFLRGLGRESGVYYGPMALAYARFSACVHGGPLGEGFLLPTTSPASVWTTALDVIGTWNSALVTVLDRFYGKDHPSSEEARTALLLLFDHCMIR